MPSTVSGLQAADHYRQRLKEAEAVLQSYGALQKNLLQKKQQAEQAATRARKDLAADYLTALTPEALAEAERLTGYRGFSRRDPIKAMEREKKVVAQHIAKIEADERYTRRQYLVGPEGEYTRSLAEDKDMLSPWVTECDRFEKLDGFLDLVAVGYDTPAFAESWWQPAYWKHWARGDAICEALKMADFGNDVLPAYKKVAAERDKWVAQVKGVEAKIADVHGVVEEHDKLVARLPRLPEIYLDQCTTVLGKFLGDADPALLQKWLDAENDEHRPIEMGLRRAAGLASKVAFLDEMLSKGIGPLVDGLRQRTAGYQHKIEKYTRWARKGRRVPAGQLDQKFAAKAQKLRQYHDKVTRSVDRMMAYDAYDRFDLRNDPSLWWVEFTGGRPSRFTPGLRAWYDRHPDAAPAHDPTVAAARHGAAVAQAVAAQGADDVGYLS